MKILYVARHTCGLNDDEGAITYGLESLGHTVIKIQQDRGFEAQAIRDVDFCLFHKWEEMSQIDRVEVPKVFWYFDLIDFDDVELDNRNRQRKVWMKRVTEKADLGFCTDGDWVRQDDSGKLIHLLQGADLRKMRPLNQLPKEVPLLLTAVRRGGKGRQTFVDDMKSTYGEDLSHFEKGIHQENLSRLIDKSAIVLAPDSPVTDSYWSNRVYLTLGFGGFLLHPYCEQLTHHYESGREIVFYKTRDELKELVDHYRTREEERWEIQNRAYNRTLEEHTYKERCRLLIEHVQRRIL